MTISIVGKLVATTAATAFAFALVASGDANAASISTHFKASGPDFSSGDASDELRTPLDFESVAAGHPLGRSSLILFSRCRNLPGDQIPPPGGFAPVRPT